MKLSQTDSIEQNMRTLEKTTYPHPYISDLELTMQFKGTPDSRYGKVKRLLAEGKLIHLKRSLYYLPDTSDNHTLPHAFEMAQFIYGPSYVSLESALSFHQLIPEAVYTTTCVTTKRAKTFSNALGRFVYYHQPPNFFLTHVSNIQQNEVQFYMATPWKAICDMIYCYKNKFVKLSEFCDNLRIEIESLPPLTHITIDELTHYYQNHRVSRFLNQAARELQTLTR